MSTLSIILNDVDGAIRATVELVSNKSYCLQFSSAICGDNYRITPERIWEIYITELALVSSWKEILNASKRYDSNGHLYEFAENKCVGQIIESINREIANSKARSGAAPEEHYKAGKTLISNTQHLISTLREVLDENDIKLQSICDELANQILQCGINFYNGSKNPYVAPKALELQGYAGKVAVGELAKDRCRKNVEILNRIISELPPIEVRTEWDKVLDYLNSHKLNTLRPQEALDLLIYCAPLLVKVKEKLGKNNTRYIQLSTLVANISLGKVIDAINASTKSASSYFGFGSSLEALKKDLVKSWEVIKSLENLDTDNEFKSQRLATNKSTLLSIIRKLDVYIGSTKSAIDMRTEDDIFKSCNSVDDYEFYCKRFPLGKHYDEAVDKIGILKKKSKRRNTITAIIIALIVLSIAGCLAWSVITADDRSYANAPRTKQGLTTYLSSWPEGKHKDEAIELLYGICKNESTKSLTEFATRYQSHPLGQEAIESLYNKARKEGVKSLNEFASTFHRHALGQKARERVNVICDSLYAIANKKHTLKAWDAYATAVPSSYYKDYTQKKQKIREEQERKKWRTESSAWVAAKEGNTISLYEKYLEFHPNGVHASQARKRIIDLRVTNIFAGDHGYLPEMDQTYYGGGSSSHITVHNDTGYTLTLLYSGKNQSKEIIIAARGVKSFTLANGKYRVAASVSAARVSNYVGNEDLQGGGYEVSYYIVHH